jgi:hypothetical protein
MMWWYNNNFNDSSKTLHLTKKQKQNKNNRAHITRTHKNGTHTGFYIFKCVIVYAIIIIMESFLYLKMYLLYWPIFLNVAREFLDDRRNL